MHLDFCSCRFLALQDNPQIACLPSSMLQSGPGLRHFLELSMWRITQLQAGPHEDLKALKTSLKPYTNSTLRGLTDVFGIISTVGQSANRATCRVANRKVRDACHVITVLSGTKDAGKLLMSQVLFTVAQSFFLVQCLHPAMACLETPAAHQPASKTDQTERKSPKLSLCMTSCRSAR